MTVSGFRSVPQVAAVVLALIASNCARGEQDGETAARDILSQHCLRCHGGKAREGGLRIEQRRDLLSLNDSGIAAIVPGKSGESELIRRVTNQGDRRMPPEGEPLSGEQIEILRRWIDAGSPWTTKDPVPVHWAYIAPTRPSLPNVRGDWQAGVRGAIDSFVLAKLSEQGTSLTPSPPAEPAKLLRRVHLDLVGIPPRPEELDEFLKDPSPEHFERIVDRLLASPHYGEKWARPWLDLARYADSNGFQADQFRSIWAYRDWVVNALNADLPFDRFTVAQIAGDLLPDGTLEDRIATGFHRCTTCNVEAGVDPEENRTNQIIDRVNTTGTVWLGTTLECAQCHNHKYDPFTQQDYYQLFAFFNNTPLEVEQPSPGDVQYEVAGPVVELSLPEQEQALLDRLRRERQAIDERLQERRRQLAAERPDWERALLDSLKNPRTWHVLTPAAFTSQGGATHRILEDGSILLTGPAPDKDTYVAEFSTNLTGITGFRLETLTDPSLPGNGPGRGSADRPNFVLYEFRVDTIHTDGSRTPVSLHSAQADFSQVNWNVRGLIDGDPKTGWGINPQFGRPHTATFLTHAPLGDGTQVKLSVTLPQTFGAARTIGRLRISAMTGDPSADADSPELRDILALAEEKRTAEQRRKLTERHEQGDSQLAALSKERNALQAQIAAIAPATTPVMQEMAQARMTSIFKRGNFLDPTAPVAPATPAALHPLASPEGKRPLNRLDFADWLVSRDNPLAARVAVNRWWAEFFGHGIVATLEDFGSQGDRPTHPELLDWLAVEFMDHGWSMKHIHRMIVLSAAYRQDSAVTPEALEQDPHNKWYARGPRVRLSAEEIRDNALAASGLLSDKMAGPPVYPPQPPNIWRHVGRNAPKYETDTDEDRFRRGLYVVYRRSAPYPSFVNFDAPDRGACVVQRSRTNTPLQALTLLNDPAYVEMAYALGDRLRLDPRLGDDRERIEQGFRLVLSRIPLSQETGTLLSFVAEERQRLGNAPEVARRLAGDSSATTATAVERAVWFEIAEILLNLDETITRN